MAADEIVKPDPAALLAAALGYAARGWPVFPCVPDGKEPATDHGFRDASLDPGCVRAWWCRWPMANVAIATGAPAVDVLDVDVKPTGNGFAAYNRLTRAGMTAGAVAIVKTRSGGLHAYFPGTAQRCSSIRRQHIDYKASGGYVLAPPSVVEGRPYVLVETRSGSGEPFVWADAVRLLVPPAPRPRVREGRARRPGEVPPWVLDRLADTAPADRSAAFHGTVGACWRAGLSLEHTVELLTPWCEATGKYADRVEAEVERSWRKIGGAA